MKFVENYKQFGVGLLAFSFAGTFGVVVGYFLMAIAMVVLGIMPFGETIKKQWGELLVVSPAVAGSIFTTIVGYRFFARLLKNLEKPKKPDAPEPGDKT